MHFEIFKGGIEMLANISVKNYLYRILTEETLEDKKEAFFEACPKGKILLLWKILCETEISDTELLKERIYEFGSKIKDDDYWGREVFLCLVAFLNLVIK